MARPEKIRLGDLLIQQGLLTDEQLKFALDEQKRSGRKLGRIVVDSSFVTEEAISQALARLRQGSGPVPVLALRQALAVPRERARAQEAAVEAAAQPRLPALRQRAPSRLRRRA